MTEIDINELRNIQLDILRKVASFCESNGIRYSLCGGSLLGAVRHHGYIPWDDDIDIMMPRPDYETFIRTFRSDSEYIVDFESEPAFRETFVKICRKNTLMIDCLIGRGSWGINIDLFPIDGVPTDKSESYVQNVLRQKLLIAKFCAYYKAIPSNKFLWFTKFAIKRLIHLEFSSVKSMKQAFNEKLRKVHFDESEYAGVISGSYGVREIVPQKVFLEYKHMAFENLSINCIVDYDTYLKAIYGKYMVLPPLQKRVNPHNYKAYIL